MPQVSLLCIHTHSNSNSNSATLPLVIVVVFFHGKILPGPSIYKHKNYGEVFSIWDRMMGTYQDGKSIAGCPCKRMHTHTHTHIYIYMLVCSRVLHMDVWTELPNMPICYGFSETHTSWDPINAQIEWWAKIINRTKLVNSIPGKVGTKRKEERKEERNK